MLTIKLKIKKFPVTCPWKYSAPVLAPACIIAISCPVISANNTSTNSSLLLSCDISFHRSAPPSTYCAHFSQWGLQTPAKASDKWIGCLYAGTIYHESHAFELRYDKTSWKNLSANYAVASFWVFVLAADLVITETVHLIILAKSTSKLSGKEVIPYRNSSVDNFGVFCSIMS